MKNRTLCAAVCIVGVTLAPRPSLADSPTTDPNPSGVTWGGYFDSYYGVNFNGPRVAAPNTGPTTSAGTTPLFLPPSQNGSFRNFDVYHNQFGLNTAELSVAKKGKEVGFKAEFDYGEVTDIIHNSAGAGANGSLDEVSKHVGQAVVSYSPSAAPKLTVNVGKMYTHVGLETVKAKDNWQYSRSDLFAVGIPYWHLGANANYAWIPGKLSTGLYVYNGWNNLVDNNSGKTYGLQAGWTPSEAWTINYNLITGAEGTGNSDYRTVNNLNAVYTVSPSLAFSADGIYGASNSSGGVTWKAVQLASKLTVSPRYYVSPRIEGYWDPEGFTTGSSKTLTELTLTNGIALGEGLETRVEARWDHTNTPSFETRDRVASRSQITASWSILYAF